MHDQVISSWDSWLCSKTYYNTNTKEYKMQEKTQIPWFYLQSVQNVRCLILSCLHWLHLMTIVQLSQKPSIETKEMIDESDSNIDDIEGLNSDAVSSFQDINKECVIYPSYKPKFMEMDGTYLHNIEIPLTFTYDAEPESTWNIN